MWWFLLLKEDAGTLLPESAPYEVEITSAKGRIAITYLPMTNTCEVFNSIEDSSPLTRITVLFSTAGTLTWEHMIISP
jgi:hypothetical protein